MKTRCTKIRIAGFTLLLAAGPTTALPVFTAGWGLNTVNAPFDATLIENAPVSGGNSRTTRWPYDPSLEFYTVTASADANRGVVGVLARISVARNTSLQTSRVEAVASMKGTVQLCAPGGTPGVCTPPAPGVPVPIPYPNFILTSTHTQTDSNSLASLFFRVSIGDDTGTLQGVASKTVLGNAGGVSLGPDNGATTRLFTSTGAFPIMFDIGALVGCSKTGCVSAIDASHSLSFVGDAPTFLGLPEGWTVWSEELNIADNRWIDPRVQTEAPWNGVPAPPTVALVLAGLAAVTVRRRRGERPVLIGESSLSPG